MNNFTERLTELMERATKGPYFVASDEAADCPPHKNSGLALIDTGRVSDWPFSRLCEWHDANLIAFLANHADEIAELVKEAENLRDVSGRFHTEQATIRLFAALAKLEEA